MAEEEEVKEEEEDGVERELVICWSYFRHLEAEFLILVAQLKDEQIGE
jgi:hypothetical protein